NTPGGICIATSHNAMSSDKNIECQCHVVQTPPPRVANERSYPCADANGDTQVKRDDTKRHPERAIGGQKRNKHIFPAKFRVRIDPDSQYVYGCENERE